ncbi:MAG: 4a-hydroxytetrahydrobiopterin dehydratase [Thermodesulfobacteriota bacterium]
MPLLNDEKISEFLTTLDGWERIDNKISKTFKTKNFVDTMGFVNKIALLSERADHHPDLGVHYSKVVVTLSTHSAGGITEKDMNLANEIEQAR